MKFRHLKQSGDTIVEVLIAVAVVSLILGGAYATSNHSLRNTRQAQEHSEALKIIQGQLEQLKVAVHDTSVANKNLTDKAVILPIFCFKDGAGKIEYVKAQATKSDTSLPAIASDDMNYSADCNKGEQSNKLYKVAISREPAFEALSEDFVFTVHARWDSVQGSGKDEVTLAYKVNK